MNLTELYVKKDGDLGYTSLDLSETSPIRITKGVQRIENPTTIASSYSQTFRVPGTGKNTQFFKSAFNVNNNVFDATKLISAYINSNGVYFTAGNIRLVNIFISESLNKVEYELLFMGEVSDFSSVISPRALSDLDLSELSHLHNFTNVGGSWDNDLFNGDIVYPLAEYGYEYSNGLPIQSTLAFYGATSAPKGFTNSANPLEITQFKPAIRARYVWNKIFEEAGFTYESNFISDSTTMDELYLITSTEGTSSATITNQCYGVVVAEPNSIVGSTVTNTKMEFPIVNVDHLNNWNEDTSEFTSLMPTGATGTYNFQIYNLFGNVSKPANSSLYAEYLLFLRYEIGGTASALFQPAFAFVGTTGAGSAANAKFWTSTAQTNDIFSWNISLPKDAKVEFFIFALDPTKATTLTVTKAFLLMQGGPKFIDPTRMLPSNYKQLDFIKGISDRFKLMWQPDPENDKNFFIEPWNDWILVGNNKDWTAKLDRNFDVTTTPLLLTQPREIIFRDSQESDVFNDNYQKTVKEVFGELEQDSGLQILGDSTREITSIFAPVPLAPIGGGNRFLIPHFAKDTELERQPIQIRPRLMFYNGLRPTTDAPLISWYIKNDSGVALSQSAYPVFSQFLGYPFDQTCTDLNWSNSPQFWALDNNQDIGSGRTSKTAFTTYWKSWFDYTYSPYTRIMEATFVLDYKDMSQLRFNDRIFVKDSWWLPIEIKDYDTGKSLQSVKVKLAKLPDNAGIVI